MLLVYHDNGIIVKLEAEKPMYRSSEPQRPPWPRVLSAGRWIDVTPGWVLAQLQTGLTPRTAEAIALVAAQTGLTVEQWYGMALAMRADDGEVTL